MQDCKSIAFPVAKSLQLSFDGTPKLSDPEVYRRVVGKLLFLNLTGHDISYSIQELSQFLSAPTQSHLC